MFVINVLLLLKPLYQWIYVIKSFNHACFVLKILTEICVELKLSSFVQKEESLLVASNDSSFVLILLNNYSSVTDIQKYFFSFFSLRFEILPPFLKFPSLVCVCGEISSCSVPPLTIQWFQGTRKVKAQGMGVHSVEEIEEFGKHDLQVLSDMLDCKPFFFGDEPTSLDVVAFAVLSQLHYLSKEVTYPLRDFMTDKCPNLVGHCSRMKEKCFPDWDEICTKLDLNAHLPKPE